jgi:hypothetical protein
VRTVGDAGGCRQADTLLGTKGAEVVAVSVPRIRGSWLERRGLLGEPDRPIAPTNKTDKTPPATIQILLGAGLAVPLLLRLLW